MKSSTSATITKIKTFVTSLQANVFMRRITKKKASLFFWKTAANYLKEIEKTGILKAQKLGKENLYLNVKLFELLSK